MVRNGRPSPPSSQQYDVSKPVFDVLSFRQIRGDAVIRYDTLNQSEPLRILILAMVSCVLLIAPSMSEVLGYEGMAMSTKIASYGLAIGSAVLFTQECKSRTKQLLRISKELDTERLPIRLPTNLLAENQFTQPVTLKDCRDQLSTPPRIIALCGTREKLNQALISLNVFGKQRLKQASVFVVAVALDGSTPTDRNEWKSLQRESNVNNHDDKTFTDSTAKNDFVPERTTWLADPYEPQTWLEYFQGLSQDTADENDGTIPEFRWFGLNSNGRSFGSGDDDIPKWLQVFGQYLRPTELLDPSDPFLDGSDQEVQTLLKAVTDFYQALTSGDEKSMQDIFSTLKSDEVSMVMDLGGRIDDWSACLEEAARPTNMNISGADATIVSPTLAYTTVVEFPADTGFDSSAGSLLAVQKWTRDSTTDQWKLLEHQIIPWSPEARAQGTLMCDCRGCVALTRTPERRTFGGVIG